MLPEISMGFFRCNPRAEGVQYKLDPKGSSDTEIPRGPFGSRWANYLRISPINLNVFLAFWEGEISKMKSQTSKSWIQERDSHEALIFAEDHKFAHTLGKVNGHLGDSRSLDDVHLIVNNLNTLHQFPLSLHCLTYSQVLKQIPKAVCT